MEQLIYISIGVFFGALIVMAVAAFRKPDGPMPLDPNHRADSQRMSLPGDLDEAYRRSQQ